MARRKSGFAVFLVILASLLMLGVVGVSQAEDCPDQGGVGTDNGIVNPPDTDDKKHGCDDETTKKNENNGSGNDADCEDDNNGNGPKKKCAAVGEPALNIRKAGQLQGDGARIGFPDPGETILFTVTFGNTGTAAATNVVIRDVVNEGLLANGCLPGQDQNTSYVAGSASSTRGTASFGSGTVTVTIASLAAGDSGTLTFRVLIPAATFHDCNRASIVSAQTAQQFSNVVVDGGGA